MDVLFEFALFFAEMLNDLCRSVFFLEVINEYEFVRRIVVGRVMNQTFVGELSLFSFLRIGMIHTFPAG
jgi:hypothetical protein